MIEASRAACRIDAAASVLSGGTDGNRTNPAAAFNQVTHVAFPFRRTRKQVQHPGPGLRPSVHGGIMEWFIIMERLCCCRLFNAFA